jgi:hypothetical protein
MFFTVAPVADHRLPYHQQLGTHVFSHDSGWTKCQQGWQKGYFDGDKGNWAKILLQDNKIVLSHSQTRSFPLWWDPDTATLTNLLGTGQSVWADSAVQIENNKLNPIKQDITGVVAGPEISMETAADLVIESLISKIPTLPADMPRKLFLTGGIDTLVLYSVLKYANVEVDIIDYDHVDYDWFLNNNFDEIKNQHWGYKQIHHWKQSTALISGACGDEFLFRGPNTVAVWAAWNNIDLQHILDTATGYQVKYFKKQKNIDIFEHAWHNRLELKSKYQNKQELFQHLLDINANDHQHWHIGNTLTWTPFLDIDLTKTIFRLSNTDLLAQSIDAALSKCIIKKLHEPALQALSLSKNYKARAGLDKLLPISQ